MSTVKHFPANAAGRDFVVSDIHGCVADFNALLAAVKFNPATDRVFSTGDLIGRGPDSMGALRLLNEPWFHAVLGNHEAMMIDALKSGDRFDKHLWIANGGAWHGDHAGDELDFMLADIVDLPLAIIVGEGASRFNVLHAEFIGSDEELSAGNFEDAHVNQLLWGRMVSKGFVPADMLPKSTTYVGHTIVTTAGRHGSMFFIDTGAFLPYTIGGEGAMTLVDVTTGDLYQVGGSSL